MATNPPPATKANQDRLAAFFTSHPPTTHPSRWDDLWRAGDFLPWDRGCANPALIDLLFHPSSSTFTLDSPKTSDGKRKRALVPGCGKGYDVALFAAAGYDALGLEVSEKAANVARDWLSGDDAKEGKEGEYKARDEDIGTGATQVVNGDFFEDGWLAGAGGLGEGFDVIYDNTFLSALPPSLRAQWALRMSQLLSPTGVLICLEFPTYKPASSGGPPWALPSVVYQELFKRPGEDIAYDETGTAGASDREESDKALVRAGHWKPARTHPVGIKDGDVKDRVSIWKHK
ncbi:S-adenosyl-L-methionine-dependent methyltransferase [Pleomassaria siparia CBS 279.74]|uniref:S-adenosyl-L-methionine-dependent methyltransferase n=1 Tax=Pleomassaria siparia CBS 279.74 TaxID=1314801 RepID=A0A6G1K625_9PLEO|nr:S-adenosyl-L-methionine-dependent methyltransferase [Pleomassaria siparia CBS 279.74]